MCYDDNANSVYLGVYVCVYIYTQYVLCVYVCVYLQLTTEECRANRDFPYSDTYLNVSINIMVLLRVNTTTTDKLK